MATASKSDIADLNWRIEKAEEDLKASRAGLEATQQSLATRPLTSRSSHLGDIDHDIGDSDRRNSGSSNLAPGQQVPWIGMLAATKDTPASHPGYCELCQRSTYAITRHHLFPRRTRTPGRFTDEEREALVTLCWPCHCILHRLIPHELLAKSYHSIEAITTHRGIQAWLRWAKELPIPKLHSFMVPKKPRRTHFDHLLPAIEQALDKIWNDRTFPGEDLRGHQRATALRKLVSQMVGSRDAQKPEIKAVMQSRPEWQTWYNRVFNF
ncbi:hypothetical protein F5B20DRAFT_148487 [Whalleya microplaca]|nr:hypothetical protein F5B20DRAFT_148487 [Whalleya microplaca]